jgi:hypothetical protein
LGVTTWTVPVVAPAGTVALIRVLRGTEKVAGVPLNVTLAARLAPGKGIELVEILTAHPFQG